MITEEEKQIIVKEVIAEIRKKYVLTEKNFNLPSKQTVRQKATEEVNLRYIAFVENVIIQAAKYYRISPEEIKKEGSRKTNHLNKRQIISHICRELPEEPIPYEFIGKCLNKDHASILNTVRKFELKYRLNTDFRLEYVDIKQMVEQSLKL